MTNRLNMLPFTHADDFEQFKQGLENFWTPFQVTMGQDSLDFNREMNDPMRRVWRTNLANLTTSDVEIMDNIGLGILNAGTSLGLLEAPETRMILNQQGFQEALHTLSYQHIIESVGMSMEEQEEFYNLWQTASPMKDKVDMAARITESLQAMSYYPPDDLVEFAICCFFYWGIYEGVWFQAGFNPNLAITKFYGLTPGTAEQLAYIQRDESEHIRFGLRFVSRILQKLSEEETVRFHTRVRELADKALALEQNYINWLYTPQQFIGYGPGSHMDFCRGLMEVRFNMVGMHAELSQHEFPYPQWRDEMLGRMESNFFERHVKEYRVGSNLQWED